MKKLLLVLLFVPLVSFGQDMKVKWEDKDGREFSIKVISGEFEYGIIPGDNISYTWDDKVSQVGSVSISYTWDDKVSQVGGMSISYTWDDKVSGTRGRVR